MRDPVHASDQFFDDDDDDDDDFFIGNIADHHNYPPSANVYVESDPKESAAPRSQVSSDPDSDSDSSTGQIKVRTVVHTPADIESDDDLIILDPPETLTHKRKHGTRQTRNSSKSFEIRSRSPTPPPAKKRAYRVPSIATSVFDTDENDEFFKEIAREANRTPSGAREATPDQPRRIYNVRFVSKLDGSMEKAVQIKVLGKYDFASILPSVLSGFTREYKIPNVMKKMYTVENVTLYWKTAKLLNFMTCNSLKIPQAFDNEISDIDITMVSKDDEKAFEEKNNSKLLGEGTSNTKNFVTPDNVNSRVEEFENELKNIDEPKSNESAEYIDLDNQDDTCLIKIALVGQDNKKIFVHVRRSTTLRNVSEYYRIKKQLPERATLKLFFDHEQLDLDGNIAELDLENEDMIEVVLK